MKRLVLLPVALGAAGAAHASLQTVSLSTDPATSPAFATSGSNSITQDLRGFTVDNTASDEATIASLTWAVDFSAANGAGYDRLNLNLSGSYVSPTQYADDGTPDDVTIIGGSIKGFDDKDLLNPIVDMDVPEQDLAFTTTATSVPFSVTVNNGYAVAKGHTEMELYFYVPAHAALTLDSAGVVGHSTPLPVPEPVTTSALALGLGGLALRRRRR